MPKYAIYGIWLKFCRLIQVLIYSVSMSKTNTNMNIFGLIKKGEYEYEYIRGDKKGRIRIRIWIFRLIFANTNTNTNIRHTLRPCPRPRPPSPLGSHLLLVSWCLGMNWPPLRPEDFELILLGPWGIDLIPYILSLRGWLWITPRELELHSLHWTSCLLRGVY